MSPKQNSREGPLILVLFFCFQFPFSGLFEYMYFLCLLELMDYGVKVIESAIDIINSSGAGQNDSTARKDQCHTFGVNHSVDQGREQLGLIGAEHLMFGVEEPFQSDGEFDIHGGQQVDNLEISELNVEIQVLEDLGELSHSQFSVIHGLGTHANHFSRSVDQSGSLRVSQPHNDGRESLGIVLGITSLQGDQLEIDGAIQSCLR